MLNIYFHPSPYGLGDWEYCRTIEEAAAYREYI
jgi:hypothetical protein